MSESTITASRRIDLGDCPDWPNIVGNFPVDLLGGLVTQTYRYLYGYVPAASPVSMEATLAVIGTPIPGWPGDTLLYGSPDRLAPENGTEFGIYGISLWWEGQIIKARWIYDLGPAYPPLCAVGVMISQTVGQNTHLTLEASEDGVSWSEMASNDELYAGGLGAGLMVLPVPDGEMYHRFWSFTYTFQTGGTPGTPFPQYYNFLDTYEGILAFMLWPRKIMLRGHVNVGAVL